MITPLECHFCNCRHVTVITTYKHLWLSCNDCGNIVRRRKTRYFFDFLPTGIYRFLPKGDSLGKIFGHNKDGADFYDYYLDERQGQKLTAQGTIWEGQLQKLRQELSSYHIDLSGRSVLDISGEPGFLAQELTALGCRTVVTGYSHKSVERMESFLNVNAIKYDFNADDISTLLSEQFDVVLIRYAINYCMDLKKLLRDLSLRVSASAIVYLSFVPPTLGTCLRWQFDDYTYNVLYHPETVARIFAEEGYETVARYAERKYHYLSRGYLRLAPFMVPFQLLNSFKPCNRELIQKDLVMIFRRIS